MPNRFDKLAKDIGREALRASGTTLVNEEIAEPALLSFQRLIKQDASQPLDETEKEFIMTMLKSWEETKAETRANDVLTVLQARGIAVPDAERERILVQTDLELLKRWLVKASVASSIDEVIEPS